MDLTLANYGYVPYGKALIGNVHKASPFDACSPIKPMKCFLFYFILLCFNYFFILVDEGHDPSPILLVERG